MSRGELVDAYLTGQITRRIFIRRLAAAGVSLAAAMTYAQVLGQRRASANSGNGFYDVYDVYDVYDDTTAPTCTVVKRTIKQICFDVHDGDSGLASIEVISSSNADVVVPPFEPGATHTVTVKARRINPHLPGRVEIEVTDRAGNSHRCHAPFKRPRNAR